jgi:hypothetical protein
MISHDEDDVGLWPGHYDGTVQLAKSRRETFQAW